ncbi:hypothetical protein Moror_6981 [Moniliophthora roreri MCA 2997]|uniref:Uncharacterized protein n=2 Tax=Moniliophthora roreri TaxID=221103 RepID=V2XBA1_MONRO|nr:hypothetical protein Moror_6981 [Moniliophthora roreri MCA 2997]KAI3619703.1 hypothetical protein WG66_002898 [Moniliophthora roreri]
MYTPFALLPFLLLPVQGVIQTAFLDDTATANITYVEGWGEGNTCDTCNLKPDASKAFQGTWHDTTHFVENNKSTELHINFTGVSLEVFCILPPKDVPAVLNYSLLFELDGQPAGQPYIKRAEELTEEYQYNVSVIALKDLENKEHHFAMILNSTELNSVALFDYATVEFEGDNATSTGTSGSASSTPTGPSSIGTGSVTQPTGGATGNGNGALGLKTNVLLGGVGVLMGIALTA